MDDTPAAKPAPFSFSAFAHTGIKRDTRAQSTLSTAVIMLLPRPPLSSEGPIGTLAVAASDATAAPPALHPTPPPSVPSQASAVSSYSAPASAQSAAVPVSAASTPATKIVADVCGAAPQVSRPSSAAVGVVVKESVQEQAPPELPESAGPPASPAQTLIDGDLDLDALPGPFHSAYPTEDEQDDNDAADEISKARFLPMTDPAAVVDLLTRHRPQDRSAETLFRLAETAQSILTAWQDEYLALDARIIGFQHPSKKPATGGRVPADPAQFEGLKEADLYGYVFDARKGPGNQDPVAQRIDGDSKRSRRVRQRRKQPEVAETQEVEVGELGKRKRRTVAREVVEPPARKRTRAVAGDGDGDTSGRKRRGRPPGRVASALMPQRVQQMREEEAGFEAQPSGGLSTPPTTGVSGSTVSTTGSSTPVPTAGLSTWTSKTAKGTVAEAATSAKKLDGSEPIESPAGKPDEAQTAVQVCDANGEKPNRRRSGGKGSKKTKVGESESVGLAEPAVAAVVDCGGPAADPPASEVAAPAEASPATAGSVSKMSLDDESASERKRKAEGTTESRISKIRKVGEQSIGRPVETALGPDPVTGSIQIFGAAAGFGSVGGRGTSIGGSSSSSQSVGNSTTSLTCSDAANQYRKNTRSASIGAVGQCLSADSVGLSISTSEQADSGLKGHSGRQPFPLRVATGQSSPRQFDRDRIVSAPPFRSPSSGPSLGSPVVVSGSAPGSARPHGKHQLSPLSASHGLSRPHSHGHRESHGHNHAVGVARTLPPAPSSLPARPAKPTRRDHGHHGHHHHSHHHGHGHGHSHSHAHLGHGHAHRRLSGSGMNGGRRH